ncbi:hypothetical protein, partial [Alistipes putredinis]
YTSIFSKNFCDFLPDTNEAIKLNYSDNGGCHLYMYITILEVRQLVFARNVASYMPKYPARTGAAGRKAGSSSLRAGPVTASARRSNLFPKSSDGCRSPFPK